MTTSSDTSFDVAQITHIRIDVDRVTFEIVIHPQAPARTTPELAQRAVELRPNLAQHACVNSASRAGRTQPTFGSVIDDTPLPHLLEHLAIDVLIEQAGDEYGSEPTFVGTSEWIDRAARTAQIQLSCPDDLLVLRAFSDALQLLNTIVVG